MQQKTYKQLAYAIAYSDKQNHCIYLFICVLQIGENSLEFIIMLIIDLESMNGLAHCSEYLLRQRPLRSLFLIINCYCTQTVHLGKTRQRMMKLFVFLTPDSIRGQLHLTCLSCGIVPPKRMDRPILMQFLLFEK